MFGLGGVFAGLLGGLVSDVTLGSFVFKFWNKRDNKKGGINRSYDLNQLKQRMRIP